MATGHGNIYILRSRTKCSPCSTTLYLTRFGADRSRDRSFGTAGSVAVLKGLTSPYLRPSLTVDSKGRPIVNAGSGSGIVVVRLNQDGSRDPGFGAGGMVSLECDCEGMYWSAAVGSAGRIMLAGHRTELGPGYPSPISFQAGVLLVRLLANGSPDRSFGTAGRAAITFPEASSPDLLAPQADGAAMGAGVGCCRPSELHLVRVDSNGARDTAFDAKALAAISGFDVFVQHEARPAALIARAHGRFDLLGNIDLRHGFELRFNSDGSINTAFGRGGLIMLKWPIAAAVADREGRVFVIGNDFKLDGPIAFRLRPDGRPDPTFGGGKPVRVPGVESFGSEVAMQMGKRPVVFDMGFSGCRQYCPPEPLLVRFRGGSSGVRCFGHRATIVGTRSGETLIGTRHRDVIAALDGNDTVRSRGGGDLICGGGGHDRLFGGAGRDRLRQ